MHIVCALASAAAHDFAQGLAYVLCGDFNVTPASSEYRLLTGGPTDPQQLPPPEAAGVGGAWLPAVAPLRSAAAVALGREPAFTTISLRQDLADRGEAPFCDTLDYILVSPQWGVAHVPPLDAGRLLACGTMPHEHEPSDHVCVSALLTL